MATLAMAPQGSPGDRLGMTLFLAIAAHALLILGVGFEFTPDEPAPPPQLTLDITLVHQRSATPPEDADYLAQVSQDGGGDTAERVRAKGPESIPDITPDPGEAPLSTFSAPPPPPPPPVREILVKRVEEAPRHRPPPPPPPVEEPPQLSAAELIQRSRRLASLAAEISENFSLHSQRPRKKQLTARTREYAYAAYMEAWRSKVERIGNLNYPDEAKRQRLSGSLMLQVDLNADGSLRDVILLRSSGEKILDDAAIRIVRLAAPYARFPPNIRKETDVLQIIRTWQFLTNNRLSSG